MKVCRGCGEFKPLDEFYIHGRMADGRLNHCKPCVRGRVRRHRRDNESARDYDRLRHEMQPGRKDRIAANAKRWGKEHGDKYRAQTAVGNAVRDGKLVRRPCEACGVDDHVHAHHDDYSKPLNVRWLCPKCHHRHHADETVGHP